MNSWKIGSIMWQQVFGKFIIYFHFNWVEFSICASFAIHWAIFHCNMIFPVEAAVLDNGSSPVLHIHIWRIEAVI